MDATIGFSMKKYTTLIYLNFFLGQPGWLGCPLVSSNTSFWFCSKILRNEKVIRRAVNDFGPNCDSELLTPKRHPEITEISLPATLVDLERSLNISGWYIFSCWIQCCRLCHARRIPTEAKAKYITKMCGYNLVTMKVCQCQKTLQELTTDLVLPNYVPLSYFWRRPCQVNLWSCTLRQQNHWIRRRAVPQSLSDLQNAVSLSRRCWIYM